MFLCVWRYISCIVYFNLLLVSLDQTCCACSVYFIRLVYVARLVFCVLVMSVVPMACLVGISFSFSTFFRCFIVFYMLYL